MDEGYASLTEKERETLRLLLHGHDAKSSAGALGLSVHTVNERLRNARRKLDVTSSKEAARILFERESDAPQFLGHRNLGDVDADVGERQGQRSPDERRSRMPLALIITGALAMSPFLAALALGLLPSAEEPVVTTEAREAEAESFAREWLELVDAGDWPASYERTASAFREANTLAVWSDVSTNVRSPLGKAVSRQLLSVEQLPTPQLYHVAKYRTDFANRAGMTETVTLMREDGEWRIVGIFVE